jgi:hypothetical protein
MASDEHQNEQIERDFDSTEELLVKEYENDSATMRRVLTLLRADSAA